jgi:WS/DGAT/MGAT family acyltransferase
MQAAAYERLSVQDRSFLVFERPGLPMHLGAVAILEGGPLVAEDGTVPLTALRAHVRAHLHLAPRYRQRLAFVPVLQRPVWVDDTGFDLRRHVRRARLPAPRDADALKRLAGHLFSLPVDRAHPLWELWVIDGLGGGRFALLAKTHHAMADGISAFGLFAALLSAKPDVANERPPRWRPRSAPDPLALLREQVAHEMRAPAELGRELASSLARPAKLRHEIATHVRAVAGLLRCGLTPVAETPLNQPVGPERRFDWLAIDLAEAKRVKARFGSTLNDVVLATVAGALRRFLGGGREGARGSSYRVVVPVSVRSQAEAGRSDNRASAWLTSLPLAEPDPVARLRLVQAATARLKGEGHARGPELLMRLAEGVPAALVDLGVRLTARLHPYNLIVTNVPGPAGPLYLRGARLCAAYPQVPLFEHQGLGIAVFTVGGSLCWGFHADPEIVPDLPHLVEAARASFGELLQASAGAGPALAGAVEPIRRPSPRVA